MAPRPDVAVTKHTHGPRARHQGRKVGTVNFVKSYIPKLGVPDYLNCTRDPTSIRSLCSEPYNTLNPSNGLAGIGLSIYGIDPIAVLSRSITLHHGQEPKRPARCWA
jgi:hypothetical protein